MTAPMPLISVVIPAHNAQNYLHECLESVCTQVGEFTLEIIVVDDGSTDATGNIARQRQDVRCLTQANQGPSAARNAGIAAARGEFIALLDADDLWPEGKLAIQLQVLQKQADAAMVFGDCRQFDANGPWSQTQFEAGSLCKNAWGRAQVVPHAYSRLLKDNFITTGSVVLRSAVLAQVGGFSEDLRLVEDLDLWLRIARRHPIAWCSEVCLLRRRHAENTSRDAQAMGLAYLEVLRRQSISSTPMSKTSATNIARLAADEYLHLAELALAQGQLRLCLKRAWQGIGTRPGPHLLWRIGKTTAKLIASRGTSAFRESHDQ